MNILQLCNKMPYPPKDGGAIAILNLTSAFSKLGHRVSMLAMNTSKHYFNPADLPQDIKQMATIDTVFVDNSLKPAKALWALLNNTSYHVSRFVIPEFQQKLIELLKGNNFDIIQLEGLYMAPYVGTIRKYSKAKIAMRAHNVEYLLWERIGKQEKNIAKRKYLNILARQLKKFEIKQLVNYDLLVPITAVDAAVFKKHGYNNPIHVCPASYNEQGLERFKNKEMEYPSLFFIGSMDWMPNVEGIDWFIDHVWDKLTKLLPGLKFYIAGRNMPQRFFSLNRKNIIVIGEVADAFDFMSSYAIMMVPLFSGGGMRVKIIEGMAMGKAVVTTTIGAEGIDCTNQHDILIADTAPDFIKIIVELFSNKLKFETIAANAKKTAIVNYSSVATAEKLTKFYSLNLE